MSFLDEFVTELEKQINYFIEKEDMKTSKRSQTMYLAMDKLTKTIEVQFESGGLTPEGFLKQIETFINLDENNMKIFNSIKFGKGVKFVQNRIELLKADRDNLQRVISGEEF